MKQYRVTSGAPVCFVSLQLANTPRGSRPQSEGGGEFRIIDLIFVKAKPGVYVEAAARYLILARRSISDGAVPERRHREALRRRAQSLPRARHGNSRRNELAL